jgi:FixJ family two-component response regulator
VIEVPLIAIVDDDTMVGEATNDLIETFGLKARRFGSAEEFLDSDCVSRISCVVADMQMPGMDGLQLHQSLRASGYEIPVIFITAFPDERIRQRALNAGAICYLRKPFEPKSLHNCIRSALRHHKGDGDTSMDRPPAGGG